MKKIIWKAVTTIILLIVAVVFAIACLNYYHIDNVNATLCAIISGCAIAANVLCLD